MLCESWAGDHLPLNQLPWKSAPKPIVPALSVHHGIHGIIYCDVFKGKVFDPNAIIHALPFRVDKCIMRCHFPPFFGTAPRGLTTKSGSGLELNGPDVLPARHSLRMYSVMTSGREEAEVRFAASRPLRVPW